MRYLNSIYFLMLIIAIVLSSCNQGVEPDNNVIGFSYTNETRSVESDYATKYGKTATIWGYSNNGGWVYNSQNGLTAILNTDDKTIEVNTGTELEYWSGDAYHFYSLWPPVQGATVKRNEADNPNGLYFDFNSDEQKDQLVSYFTVSGADAETRTEPVHFEYLHVLSNVVFNIRKNTANTADEVVLLSFSLSGVQKSGTCAYLESATPTWSYGEKTTITMFEQKDISEGTVEDGDVLPEGFLPITAQPVGANVVSDGYLIVPQSIPYNTVAVNLIYAFRRTTDNTVHNIKEINNIYLPIDKISKWEQNKKYTYYIYLAAESNNIIFGSPTVDNWGTTRGAPTIIFQ